jgi:hypothetical protein
MKYTKRQVILAYKNGVLSKLRKQLIVSEIRKEYDADDELAILRQREEKPTEYAAYNSYVEGCKKAVDEYVVMALRGAQ